MNYSAFQPPQTVQKPQYGQNSQLGNSNVKPGQPQYVQIPMNNFSQPSYIPQPVQAPIGRIPQNTPYYTQDMNPQYLAQQNYFFEKLKQDQKKKQLREEEKLQPHKNIQQKMVVQEAEDIQDEKSQEYAKIQAKALITKTVNFSKSQGTKFYFLNQQLKVVKKEDEKFTDQEFQPTVESITEDPEWHKDSSLKPSEMVWKRAQHIWKDKLTIVDKSIDPNDIAQGALGDCYYLSSLSVLAEKPQLIERLFEIFEVNKQGVYAVWLCIDGEWTNFILDDYIPCDKHHQPAFSRSINGELWVLLLEKAYAKAFHSYQSIEAGITNYALKDLTGAPYGFVRNNKQTLDELWSYMFNNEQKGYIQTAASQQDSQGDKAKDKLGIVYSHAYAILDVKQLNNDGKQLQLIKLRNPWGSGEWKGDWSDGSDLWTPQLKKLVNYVNKNDGCFWMDVQDYQKEFDCTFVSYCNEKYKYAYEKLHMKQQNSQKIGFSVTQSGHAFIQITQKCQRGQTHDDYKFSFVKLIIYQEDKNGNVVRVLDGKQSNERDIHIELANLEKGYYQAFVSADWNQKYCNDLVISSYSQNNIYFDKISTPILNQNLIEQILYKQPNQKQPTSLSNNCTELVENFAGYVYMLFKNTSGQDKQFSITPTTTNLILMNPYERDQEVIKFVLRAESAHIVKWKIDPKGKGSYSFSVQQSFTA